MEKYFEVLCMCPLFRDIAHWELTKALRCLNARVFSFEKGEADAKAKSAMIAKQKEEKQKKEAEFKGYLSLAQENCNADKFKDAKTCLDKARAVCDGSDSQNKQIRDMESNINQKSGEGSIFGGVVDKSDGKNVVFKASKTKPAPAPKSDDEDSESEDEADE